MKRGVALALALMSFSGVAYAQEEDLYFETVRDARDDQCSGKKYVCYDLLSTHRRDYFITGFTGNTEVKFQFSVKYNLWPNESPSSVHLGYTQKSLWNLYKASSPFVETNYDPELFYTYSFGEHGKAVAQTPSSTPEHDRADDDTLPPPPRPVDGATDAVGCRASYVRGGVEHESNGLSGPQSRGWNRVYVSGQGGCELSGPFYVVAGLKVWAPPWGASDNPDISKYLGSGELSVAAGASSDSFWGSAEIGVTGRKGWRASWKAGGLEVDARWRPGYATFAESWRFIPYLFGQLYTGYGETLLDYNNPETSVRVGIGVTGAVRLRR